MSVQPGSRCAGRAQTQTVKGSAPVLVLVASAVLASFNCSSSVEESPAGPDPGVPVYQLVVADSFGVEMGDSLELIGSIDGFCYHPSGSVLILDRVMGRVRIVPENGNPTTFGRLGHGPGEFYSPRGICAMEDGRILVSEPGRRTVMEFDGMGEYLGPYLQERVNGVTTEMYPVGPNSIAGTGYEVTLTNGRLTSLRYYVGRFDSSAVPSIEYHELFSDLSTADVYREMDLLDFCAEQGGTVFVVTDVTDYRITVFSADGSVERAIEPGVARLPKTDEEIRSEIEEFDDSHTGDRAYTGGYEPSPYHPLIELAGVDGDGRLWVRRLDAAEGYLFDVWDSMGSLACQVMLEDVAGDLELTFHVDRYGVLGANLDSDWHPRVYMLVLDDSERSELQRNPGTAENHT